MVKQRLTKAISKQKKFICHQITVAFKAMTPNDVKIKMMLVDDQKLIREGIGAILSTEPDIDILMSLSSGEQCVNAIREERPDVILMDILMTGMTGIETARWIKEFDPSIRIILLSQETSKEYVSAGIQSGVDGYLSKDVDRTKLLTAVRTVFSGQRYFDEAIMKLVFEDFYRHEKSRTSTQRLPNDLTKRELEVLTHVAEGHSNKELAEALFISVKTVETHKMHIMEKLGMKNTAELIKYALKNNIISIDPHS